MKKTAGKKKSMWGGNKELLGEDDKGDLRSRDS